MPFLNPSPIKPGLFRTAPCAQNTSHDKKWVRVRCFLGLSIGLALLLGSGASARGEDESFLLRDDNRVRGDRQAPVTLLEYSDFTCGFCVKFFLETWPRLFSEYVQPGKVRLVYRDFPRASTGAGVETAQAARCAGEQGQYWVMHDRLFASKSKFGRQQLHRQAEDLGLDIRQFTECFQSDRYVDAIHQDRLEGGSIGIRGTPGFVLFLTQHVNDGPLLIIPGAFPYDVFKEQIDRLLKKALPERNTGQPQAGVELPVRG